LYSNILSLFSSLSVRDHVSHSYKTVKILVLYIFMFKVFREDIMDRVLASVPRI
jgi:hypothetical protein